MNGPRIRITSQRDGFRRAGVSHPKGPKEYSVDHFTEEQIKAFLAEPLLSVSPVFDDVADDGGDPKPPTADTDTRREESDGKPTGGGDPAAAGGEGAAAMDPKPEAPLASEPKDEDLKPEPSKAPESEAAPAAGKRTGKRGDGKPA